MDIVRFKGGLGNQMFQYALLKSLSLQGRKVTASLGFYSRPSCERAFCLNEVFENVCFEVVNERIFKEIDIRWRAIKHNEKKIKEFLQDYANRFFWVEDAYGTYDESVFKTCNCAFVGYWQTEKYFGWAKKELLHDFKFSKGEEQLEKWKKRLTSSENYVSVHIRRGDYLKNSELYGNLSVSQYYEKAMRLAEKRNSNSIFVFFSDDIEWVKEHYYRKRAIYIQPELFDHYQMWYDMCLMSCCAHNIIANSSYSWWGAWLNGRGGTVIAPKLWLKGYEMPDICPDSWIRV